MRVGVTGAGGYIGRALVRRLVGDGYDVLALVRSSAPPAGPAIRSLQGDVRDPAVLGELAAGSDAVVHAAAYVHRAADTGRARAECFAVNEGATRALIAALVATARRHHVVFVSTTAVYGSTFRAVSERDPERPTTAYGHSKLAAERAVLEAARSGAITACVLRPAVVYGVGAPGNTARLIGLVRRGWVPRVGGGSNLKSMVHVDDVAESIAVALAPVERSNGRTFNVAADPITVQAMVEAIAAGLGVRPRWLDLPGWLVDAGAGLTRVGSRLTAGALPDLSRATEAFRGEATVDAQAIAAELGMRFRPTLEGIRVMSAGAA